MTVTDVKNDSSATLGRADTGCPKMGRKIKELRLLRGLSQFSLGNIVGISFQQIQKYESGKNAISIDKLCAIAKALSVDVTVLLPTTTENDAALHEDSNGFKYDSDEECEIENDMLALMRGYRKIKNKELRKVVYSLVKSLSSFED